MSSQVAPLSTLTWTAPCVGLAIRRWKAGWGGVGGCSWAGESPTVRANATPRPLANTALSGADLRRDLRVSVRRLDRVGKGLLKNLPPVVCIYLGDIENHHPVTLFGGHRDRAGELLGLAGIVQSINPGIYGRRVLDRRYRKIGCGFHRKVLVAVQIPRVLAAYGRIVAAGRDPVKQLGV